MRVITIVEKITIMVVTSLVPSFTSVCPGTTEWTPLCLFPHPKTEDKLSPRQGED